MKIIVITRHEAFVEYAKELGIVEDNYEVIPHATPDQIRGQWVVSSGLPLHLAALAKSVMTIPMDIPPEARGKELGIQEMRKYAGDPVPFVVLDRDTFEEMAIEAYNNTLITFAAWKK